MGCKQYKSESGPNAIRIMWGEKGDVRETEKEINVVIGFISIEWSYTLLLSAVESKS